MRNIYLSNERYKAALNHIKSQIEGGSELIAIDSTDIGDKYTHCSWGLCSCSIKQWPDKQDWMFDRTHELHYYSSKEKTPIEDTFVDAKYQEVGQHCPMDKDQSKETNPSGCFYRCKIFQDKLGNKIKDREEVVKLYEITIKKLN